MVEKRRILSGMRPTGRLHLGNYHGALVNWLQLQEQYECFFFVADWHALTTDYANPDFIKQNTYEMIIDWLSVGLNPEKCTIFVQSQVKEHAELYLLLGMITPLPWLERNPTYKEIQAELHQKDLATYGFLGYPVLQAADIIIYRAHGVPVGKDQLPHVELTREIARRFNYLYKQSVFPIPEPLLTDTPLLPGLDNRKMSKSYDNCIYISESNEETRKKVSQMYTDPKRARRSDPGTPETCPVYAYHKLYNNPERIESIAVECKRAGIGCVECKKEMAEKLLEALGPIREKREYYEKNPKEVKRIMEEGTNRAREEAQKTMQVVRRALTLAD